MNKLILGLAIQFFCHTIAAAQEYRIYSSEKPDIIPVWHRVADFAPVLRSVESARLSPDGEFAVSASKFGYNLMVWRVADGTLLWSVKEKAEIECAVFSPDGKSFATGDENFLVKIRNTENGHLIRELEHDSSLDGIAWSHDGKILAAGSEKGEVWLWDAKTYSLITKIKAGSTVNSLDFSSDDGRLIVAGNIQAPDAKKRTQRYDGFVKMIDMKSYKITQEYEGPRGSIKSVRFSQNGKYFACAGFDSTARIYDAEKGTLIKSFREPMKIEAVAFTPDGQYLVSGGHQRKISFYRIDDLTLAHELPTPRTEYLDFSKDGRLLLTAHEDSGLLSLYLFISSTQHTPGLYQKIERETLNNKDLKN
jgi:WD40 repeat protein